MEKIIALFIVISGICVFVISYQNYSIYPLRNTLTYLCKCYETHPDNFKYKRKHIFSYGDKKLILSGNQSESVNDILHNSEVIFRSDNNRLFTIMYKGKCVSVDSNCVILRCK